MIDVNCPKCNYSKAIGEIFIEFDGTAYEKIICSKCGFRQTKKITKGD